MARMRRVMWTSSDGGTDGPAPFLTPRHARDTRATKGAGSPARSLRRRVPEEVAQRLVRIGWWDWPIDRILAGEAAICGADVDALERSAPTAQKPA